MRSDLRGVYILMSMWVPQNKGSCPVHNLKCIGFHHITGVVDNSTILHELLIYTIVKLSYTICKCEQGNRVGIRVSLLDMAYPGGLSWPLEFIEV